MKCPSCDRDIDESVFPPGLAYCPFCGQELKPVSEDKAQLLFCPYCGQRLSDQTTFCPHCGKKLILAETKLDIHDIQQMGKDFIEKKAKPIAKAIRNKFGRERKTRKLYQQWAEYDALPPEEIPSMDTLKQMSAEKKIKKHSKQHDSNTT